MVSGSTLAIAIAPKLGTAADGAPRSTSAYASPVAPRLAPGEQVMFQGHPSWRSILAFYVKGLFGVLVVAFARRDRHQHRRRRTDAGLVTVVAVVGVALVVLAGFIKRITIHYTITTPPPAHQARDHLARHPGDAPGAGPERQLRPVASLQRLLQVGDVDFDTAAGDDFNFVFAGVADPAEVVERVDRATHAGPPTGLGDEPTAPQPASPPPPSASPAI